MEENQNNQATPGEITVDNPVVVNPTPAENAAPVQNEAPVYNEAPVQNEAPVYNEAPVQNNNPVYNEAPVYYNQSGAANSEQETVDDPKADQLCLAAMIVGICAFFINPLYMTSVAAIILGLVAQGKNSSKKKMAMAGWIMGIVSIFAQLSLDSVVSLLTAGMGSFFFCC